MIFLYSFIALSSLAAFILLCFFAIYQFSVKGDVSFYVMLFALIFLCVSFYGAVGFTYAKLKDAGTTIRII